MLWCFKMCTPRTHALCAMLHARIARTHCMHRAHTHARTLARSHSAGVLLRELQNDAADGRFIVQAIHTADALAHHPHMHMLAYGDLHMRPLSHFGRSLCPEPHVCTGLHGGVWLSGRLSLWTVLHHLDILVRTCACMRACMRVCLLACLWAGGCV